MLLLLLLLMRRVVLLGGMGGCIMRVACAPWVRGGGGGRRSLGIEWGGSALLLLLRRLLPIGGVVGVDGGSRIPLTQSVEIEKDVRHAKRVEGKDECLRKITEAERRISPGGHNDQTSALTF